MTVFPNETCLVFVAAVVAAVAAVVAADHFHHSVAAAAATAHPNTVNPIHVLHSLPEPVDVSVLPNLCLFQFIY